MREESTKIVANFEKKADEIQAASDKLNKSVKLMEKSVNSDNREESVQFIQQELQSAQSNVNLLETLIASKVHLCLVAP